MGVISLGQVLQSSVAIANGGTTSAAIPTQGLSLVGIFLPAALTSTTLTFTACATEGGTYEPMYSKAGTALSYTVGTSRYLTIDPSDFAGVPFFKMVLGSAEIAARTLVCSLKGM